MTKSLVQVHENQLRQAITLGSRRLYHAALEAWSHLLNAAQDDTELRAQVLDGLGQVYLHLGHSDTALRHFKESVTYSQRSLVQCRYREHEAIAHSRLYDYDRALRIMVQALEECWKYGDSQYLARLLINLSFVQGLNSFHQDSIVRAEQSLDVSTRISGTPYYAEVYNNIGVAYLDQQMYDEAEVHLLKALQCEGNVTLSSLLELSRLYFLQDDLENTLTFGTRAVDLVWSSIVSYEKDEVARLCQLLASVSYVMGENHLAMRLIEKAQLMFGQLGMWREWDQAQFQMDDWQVSTTGRVPSYSQVAPLSMERFITLLDVMNAQELMHDKFSSLLDTRVLYASILSDELDLSSDDRQKFIYACRFADYGLTALEPDVMLTPRRSRQAWEQYQQHPDLSVRMLESLQLERSITQIIADHHENYDGSGYPRQKFGNQIVFLARLFAVVDRYAFGVTIEEQSHTFVLQSIIQDRGKALDPCVVDAFHKMFLESVEELR